MSGLHKNQQKILDYLLEHKDGATVDELAEYLRVTKTAAKEHILKIEHLGYLSYLDSSGSVGRPKRRYLLSQSGMDVFPKQYSWLSNVVLEYLAESTGPDTVVDMMDSLAEKVAKSMRSKFINAKTTAELLKLITEALNELGYRSSLKQSDLRKGAIIEATNCVYHSVAQKHPTLCRFDVKFIENATNGMNVKLESCIAKGGAVCRFCIRKK
ncbi:MAG: L-2-amino-thiazoline-4-carboxylic acid hydrolase [Bdellovibrionaceae bacterium]|nr:L-2-amino-thiazoline-4-carboxylic acid hydrolase [Pseudobdellovibrionaceae bacterium]